MNTTPSPAAVPTTASAPDFVALAATITGDKLYTLARHWTANEPTSAAQHRAWNLAGDARAYQLWDAIRNRILARVYWSAPISDGVTAMSTAALAVAVREQLTAEEYAALVGPWELLAGPIG
ncbi:hypothetical protein [Kitasatospora sp. NPDC059160]|uniref:hypothetical protein n=1 Tax=Kitasatospora sp. NPDC059160 TaxID=3346748 RepID=UPI0036C38906